MNDVLDVSGEKLITSAFLFGGAGVVFTTIPFLGVLIYGIVKSQQGGHNKSSDILSVVAWAFVVHAVASFLFYGLILVLDKTNLDTPNFYTTKIFPIFWAETKAQVISLSGAGADDILSSVAYSTLNLLQVVTKWFYMSLPIVVLVLAMFYGIVLSSKDSYEKSYVNVMAYSSISFVAVSLMYLFWAKISTIAIFMTNGDIVSMISKMWANALQI